MYIFIPENHNNNISFLYYLKKYLEKVRFDIFKTLNFGFTGSERFAFSCSCTNRPSYFHGAANVNVMQ